MRLSRIVSLSCEEIKQNTPTILSIASKNIEEEKINFEDVLENIRILLHYIRKIRKKRIMETENYIMFEGVINQEATLQLANAIKNASNSKINIFFSSLGGSIYEGFVLASIIQNSKVPIRIHATNHIDSIANVIYLAAKERTAESHAKFYLHGAATAEASFDEKGLKDQLSSIKTNNSRIAHYVSENSKIQLKKVQSMMETGTTISSHEAKKYGIVNNILHSEIPRDSSRVEIIYIN